MTEPNTPPAGHNLPAGLAPSPRHDLEPAERAVLAATRCSSQLVRAIETGTVDQLVPACRRAAQRLLAELGAIRC